MPCTLAICVDCLETIDLMGNLCCEAIIHACGSHLDQTIVSYNPNELPELEEAIKKLESNRILKTMEVSLKDISFKPINFRIYETGKEVVYCWCADE